MMTLLDGTKLFIELIKEPEFRMVTERTEILSSEILKGDLGEKIYILAEGEVFVNCIFPLQGLRFQSLDAYKIFTENCTFTYIPAAERVIYIEVVHPFKYRQLNDKLELRNNFLSNKLGMDVYLDSQGRVYTLDAHFKTGLIYQNLEEFHAVRREYGFDESDSFIIPI